MLALKTIVGKIVILTRFILDSKERHAGFNLGKVFFSFFSRMPTIRDAVSVRIFLTLPVSDQINSTVMQHSLIATHFSSFPFIFHGYFIKVEYKVPWELVVNIKPKHFYGIFDFTFIVRVFPGFGRRDGNSETLPLSVLAQVAKYIRYGEHITFGIPEIAARPYICIRVTLEPELYFCILIFDADILESIEKIGPLCGNRNLKLDRTFPGELIFGIHGGSNL